MQNCPLLQQLGCIPFIFFLWTSFSSFFLSTLERRQQPLHFPVPPFSWANGLLLLGLISTTCDSANALTLQTFPFHNIVQFHTTEHQSNVNVIDVNVMHRHQDKPYINSAFQSKYPPCHNPVLLRAWKTCFSKSEVGRKYINIYILWYKDQEVFLIQVQKVLLNTEQGLFYIHNACFLQKWLKWMKIVLKKVESFPVQ